jgi:hypothetical protein
MITNTSRSESMSRVWVSPEREFRELGEVQFNVSWEQVKPSAKGKDDIDPDCDIEYLHKAFKDEARAKAYAQKVVERRETAYGCASITPQVVGWLARCDGIAEWQDAGEREYV